MPFMYRSYTNNMGIVRTKTFIVTINVVIDTKQSTKPLFIYITQSTTRFKVATSDGQKTFYTLTRVCDEM